MHLVEEVGLVNLVHLAEEVHLVLLVEEVHLAEEVVLVINTDDNDTGQLTSLVAADTVGIPGKPITLLHCSNMIKCNKLASLEATLAQNYRF